MAAKRAYVTVRGYLHSVTPVKPSMYGGAFDFTFQCEKKKVVQGTCYNTGRRDDFVRYMKQDGAVQISAVEWKERYGGETGAMGLKCGRGSMISLATEPVDFKKSYDTPLTNIKDIVAGNFGCKAKVNVVAKVIRRIKPPYTENIMGIDKQKEDIIVADATACIKLSVFDEAVGDLVDEKTYRFEGCGIRVANDIFHMVASFTFSYVPMPDLPNHADVPDHFGSDECEIVGKVIGCEIMRVFQCTQCRKRIDVEGASTTVRCDGCNFRQLYTTSNMSIHGTCEIKYTSPDSGDEQHKRVFMGGNLIRQMTQTDVDNCDVEDIELALLMCNAVKMQIDLASNRITSVSSAVS